MPTACFSASVIGSALKLRKASWFFLHSGLVGIDLSSYVSTFQGC
jgi:hypothetical protein